MYIRCRRKPSIHFSTSIDCMLAASHSSLSRAISVPLRPTPALKHHQLIVSTCHRVSSSNNNMSYCCLGCSLPLDWEALCWRGSVHFCRTGPSKCWVVVVCLRWYSSRLTSHRGEFLVPSFLCCTRSRCSVSLLRVGSLLFWRHSVIH